MVIPKTSLKIHFHKYIYFSFKDFPFSKNPPKYILPGTAGFKKMLNIFKVQFTFYR